MNLLNKKVVIVVGVLLLVIALPLVWYLASPLVIRTELNENLPDSSVNRSDLETEMDKMKDETTEISEVMPKGSGISLTGNFQKQVHDVSGQVKLIGAQNSFFIRLENFMTLNGPDLHVYASKDLEATDYIDLGKLKATKGSFNYELGQEIDFATYKYILIWCEPFGVLFGSAELK